MSFPVIPGYRILKEIGRGGMAKIYLAREEKMEREVALKVLLRSLSEEENVTTRFLGEAKTAAKLRHTNIVPIYDVGHVNDIYFFTMEHLEGSLRDRFNSGPPLTAEEALWIIKQIAGALIYAHQEGLIHRDIKPGNILFREDGTPVLVDFGIAKAVDSPTRLTKTGTSMGTAYYMSPEQIKGENLDPRTDIYSLGVVLYEMLSGKVPFDGTGAISISIKHLQEPIPRLPDPFDPYQKLVERMLAKDREKRIQSARELIECIDGYSYAGGEASIPIVVTAKKKPKRKERSANGSSLLWTLSAIVLILGCIGLWLFYGHSTKPRVDHLEDDAAQEMAAEMQPPEVGEASAAESEPAPRKKISPDAPPFRKDEYDRLVKLAADFFKQGNYTEARKRVLEAKRIKINSETEALERAIDTQISRLEEQEQQAAENRRRADNLAFEAARAVGTIRAFEEYLDRFPTGLKAAAVREKLADLKSQSLFFQEVAGKALKLYKNQQGYWEAILYSDIVMVHIPAGRFRMGVNNGDADRRPVHDVYLDEFWIGKYEVTFSQYDRFCDATGRERPRDRGWGRNSHPVIAVSWNSTLAYCNWLSQKTGLNFDLPTEAQWEKTARGSSGRRYPWGNSNPDAGKANYDGDGDGYANLAPVGSFVAGASPYGALDLAGNVWEWCRDWYGSDYYAVSPSGNPLGPAVGSRRVVRGGGWKHKEKYLDSSCRGRSNPSSQDPYTGFRLVLENSPG